MKDRVYDLDAAGDVLLDVYHVPDTLPQNLSHLDPSVLAGFPAESSPSPKPVDIPPSEEHGIVDDDGINTGSLLRIRASSKHLTLASPVFECALKPGFQEGDKLRSTGQVNFPIKDFDAIPFLILMMVLHGRTRAVPRKISLQRLVEIAVLVDYYGCYEAVDVFSDMWIDALDSRGPITSVPNAEKWLFVSWVFQRGYIFEKSSSYLQLENKDKLLAVGLPIPYHVRDAIDRSRENAFEKTIEHLHNFLVELQDSSSECSYECDCMLLGALTKHMRRMRILLPRPEGHFEGLSFRQLSQDCGRMENPQWKQGCSASLHDCDLESRILPLLGDLETSLQPGLDIKAFAELRI